MQLNPRKRRILSAIIKAYIIIGEPVSSKAICDLEDLNLSSATIRAQLKELCDLGYLEQPHTSAGRIPSAMGYRYYIEQLMNKYSLTDEDKRTIDGFLPEATGSAESIIEASCEALATLTNCAAMLTTPSERDAKIKKVEFVLIGRRTVVVVLATTNGIIKDTVTKSDFDLNVTILEKIDNVLNKTVYNLTLEEITAVKAQEILLKLGPDALVAAPVIAAFLDVVEDAIQSQIKIQGAYNLLLHSDYPKQKAKNLLDFLNDKSMLLAMLSNASDEFTVVLGNEIGEMALSSSGFIVTSYSVGDRNVGSVGVLGPERMDYEHVIPGVLYFRDSLSRLLTKNFYEDF